MASDYRVISADSHLEIPVERWAHRIPDQYRDQAPRLIRLPDGTEAQFVEGQPLSIETKRDLRDGRGANVRGGSFADNDGAGSPEQRLEEQDLDSVDAEVLFLGIKAAALWRGIKDDRAYGAMVHAYNEWLAEEYCSVAPERLIGLGFIPETNVEEATAELAECIRLGLKGIQLNAFPSGNAFPTPEDDVFWAAAVDAGMPVTVHVQFRGGRGEKGLFFKYDREPDRPVATSQMDPVKSFANVTKYGVTGAGDAARLIFAGVFDRFPGLQVYFAETQIGWIPMWFEAMDDTYNRNIRSAEDLYGVRRLDRLPSEYIKEHCLWGFGDNPVGLRLRHDIGVDHVMWYSDFPHPVTSWPHSASLIEKSFSGIPEDEKDMMVAGNCIRFFHLGATAL